MKQLRIFVSGRVQGVNFRYASKELARKLGLTGYARNLSDGRLELFVEGEEEAAFKFMQWCRKGPSFARVEHVDFQEFDSEKKYSAFSIIF